MSCKHAPSPFIPFKYITSRHFRTVPWQNGDLILSSSPEEQKLELLQTSFAMLYPSLSERPLLASRPQDLNWAFVPTPAAEVRRGATPSPRLQQHWEERRHRPSMYGSSYSAPEPPLG